MTTKHVYQLTDYVTDVMCDTFDDFRREFLGRYFDDRWHLGYLHWSFVPGTNIPASAIFADDHIIVHYNVSLEATIEGEDIVRVSHNLVGEVIGDAPLGVVFKHGKIQKQPMTIIRPNESNNRAIIAQ